MGEARDKGEIIRNFNGKPEEKRPLRICRRRLANIIMDVKDM